MSLPDSAKTDAARDLASLLSRIALGDRAAFTALYQRTSAHLLGVILRINKDRAQAEDVLQEVFVKVWAAAGSFDGTLAQPMTWLASIARHRAIDSLRRRQTEPVWVTSRDVDGEASDDMLDLLPSEAAGPLEALGLASEAHAVQRCMQGLSNEQRQSVALAFYQGLSHAEVADHLKEPLGSVKSWIRRGLLALRDCLGLAPAAARAKG